MSRLQNLYFLGGILSSPYLAVKCSDLSRKNFCPWPTEWYFFYVSAALWPLSVPLFMATKLPPKSRAGQPPQIMHLRERRPRKD